MSAVVVVSTVRARNGHRDAVLAGLRGVAEHAHAETACLAYAVHQDVDDACVFVVVERWTSQAALENHLLQPYVRDALSAAQESLDGPPEPRVCRGLASGDPSKGTL